MKCSFDISNFLEEIGSRSPFCCFLIFLCIVHWRRPSCLFLLSSGTLHSGEHTFPCLPCFLLFFCNWATLVAKYCYYHICLFPYPPPHYNSPWVKECSILETLATKVSKFHTRGSYHKSKDNLFWNTCVISNCSFKDTSQLHPATLTAATHITHSLSGKLSGPGWPKPTLRRGMARGNTLSFLVLKLSLWRGSHNYLFNCPLRSQV